MARLQEFYAVSIASSYLVCLSLYFGLGIGYPLTCLFTKLTSMELSLETPHQLALELLLKTLKVMLSELCLNRLVYCVRGGGGSSCLQESCVVEVEALAYRRAVSFAIEIGLQEVVSEGDSKTIISSLNSDCSCLAHFVHLVEDCRVHAGNLRFSAFTHVRRIYNVVADKF